VAPGLRRLLAQLGHDPVAKQLEIAPIPGAHGAGINFGVTAARALADGRVDGFWANGMGAALAQLQGTGTVIIDARRDAIARPSFDFTFPVIACTDAFLAAKPGAAAAAARAMRAAHGHLRADPQAAGRIGRKLFPPAEAELIVELVRRDLPYYHSALRPESLQSMLEFSRAAGIDAGTPAVADLVASEAAAFWEPEPFRLPPVSSCG
jgi:ABC-type nitrate/sulfonate/bicarbonate transport system substrate-binding protein